MVTRNRFRSVQPGALIGPLRPGLHAKAALERHEQGIIRQPAGIFRLEGRHRLPVTAPAPGLGLFQQGESTLIYLAVVHIARLRPPSAGVHLRLGQEVICDEGVQVDEVGVACKGRKGLVGGIPIAGRAKGQKLPVFLPCLVKKICKAIRRFAKGPDAVWRREGGDWHQNASGTIHMSQPFTAPAATPLMIYFWQQR